MKLFKSFILVTSLAASISWADNAVVITNNTNNTSPITTPTTNTKLTGLYLGADLGTGSSYCNNCQFSFDSSTGTILTATSLTKSGPIFDMFVGYQFNPYIAIEAGFGRLPNINWVATEIVQTPWEDYSYTNTITTNVIHGYFALVGMLPLPEHFGLFAKTGYDTMQVSFTRGNVIYASQPRGYLLSGGVNYDFTSTLSGTLSYNHIATSDSGSNYQFNYGALGVIYRFRY